MEFVPRHVVIKPQETLLIDPPGQKRIDWFARSSRKYPAKVIDEIAQQARLKEGYDRKRLAELLREAGAIYLGQRAQEHQWRQRQVSKETLKKVSDLAQRLRCAVLELPDGDDAHIWGQLPGFVMPVEDAEVAYRKQKPKTPEPRTPRHFPHLPLDRDGTLQALVAMSERADFACKYIITSPRNRPNDLVLGIWIESMHSILTQHLGQKFTFNTTPTDAGSPHSGRGKSVAAKFCQAAMRPLDRAITPARIESEMRKNIKTHKAERRRRQNSTEPR